MLTQPHALLFTSRNRRWLNTKYIVAMTNDLFGLVYVYFESTSNAEHVDRKFSSLKKCSNLKIKLETAREQKKNCVKMFDQMKNIRKFDFPLDRYDNDPFKKNPLMKMRKKASKRMQCDKNRKIVSKKKIIKRKQIIKLNVYLLINVLIPCDLGSQKVYVRSVSCN